MDKNQALNEFFKGLHISLNNAIYFRGHPYSIKSTESFKEKIDILFSFLNPIKINIAPESLFLDGRNWEKETLHVALAQIFHLRKIKSIEFREGLSTQELVGFLDAVSLPPKEIIKGGGIENISKSEKRPHILIEELDYSQFLRGEGEECKDIWGYLLKDVVEKKDKQKISEFADNFGLILGKFKDKDLFDDEQLKLNLVNFLKYLKDNQKEKFDSCTKEMFDSLLKYKDALPDERIEKVKVLFKDLNVDDFASLLLYKIIADESFDSLGFQLFSRLSDEKRHKEIASSLLDKAVHQESLKDNPKAIKKIQDLLSDSHRQFTSGVYQHTLSSLLRNISGEERLFFERHLLRAHYRLIILNLLDQERNKESLSLILESLSREWEELTKDKDWEYIKKLTQVVKKIKKEDTSLADLFAELEKRITNLFETIIWEEGVSLDFNFFVGALEKTSLDSDFYLDKIFGENKINSYGLRLFFKFFPQKAAIFYENLKKKSFDIEFMVKTIEVLKSLDSTMALEILKYIYSFANEFIKIEVLKAMQVLSMFDKELLFSILQKKDVNLKREALAILAKEEQAKREALKILLCIPSPWGLKNKIILQNSIIIEELGLKEGREYLEELGRRRFFWNKQIRKKAQEILAKWQY